MASIDIKDDRLVVKLHGLDRILAFRGSLAVPLEHVDGVRANPPEGDFDAAVRDPSVGTGLFLGGRLAVGTVSLEDGLSFYDVHHKERTIAIDLSHEQFRHLILEIDDETPSEAASRVAIALEDYRSRRLVKEGRRPDDFA